MKGPIPSVTGYYVLGRVRTQGDLKGSVSIEAQDIFFSSTPIHDAMDSSKLQERQAAFVFQEVINRPPQQIPIAGHQFVRFDHTGTPYHHARFSTVLRCHVVSIEITSRFPEVFRQLEASLERLSLPETSDFASGGGPAPVCVKDYISDATLIHRVDPVMVGPRFTKVPVRFVIDDHGRVKHIHVINALPDQAKSVEEALAQWVFKPYLQNGRPVELETGIVFEFPPNGQRQTSTASRF
ncbi:MAG: energy transducer TonB [Candidatus Sulfotelmatobacter sp.]